MAQNGWFPRFDEVTRHLESVALEDSSSRVAPSHVGIRVHIFGVGLACVPALTGTRKGDPPNLIRPRSIFRTASISGVTMRPGILPMPSTPSSSVQSLLGGVSTRTSGRLETGFR